MVTAGILPFRENSHGRARIQTRDIMISRLRLWPLDHEAGLPKIVVLRILKEDLGKRKLCARFFPHCLTPEKREDRVTSCQDIIATADANKKIFNKIITGVETWCFAYDPETTTGFWMGWWDNTSAGKTEIPKVPHQDHIYNFFDSQGLVRKEFVPEGKTINAEFYKIPEAHSTGSSSCVLLSRFFLVAL